MECVTSRNTKLVQERLFQNNVLTMHQPPVVSDNATAKSGTRRDANSRVQEATPFERPAPCV